MPESWEHYRCSMQGQPAAFLVDLGAMDLAPDVRRPVLITVRVALRRPRPDGLNALQESATLQRLEDLLVERMARSEGRYVGRVTHAGSREFCFYAADQQGVARQVQAALDEGGYRGALLPLPDPKWDHYRRFLWPERDQMQAIVDRRMVQSLGRKGDSLQLARPVTHWVAFDGVDGRDAMLLLLSDDWECQVRCGLEAPFEIGLALTKAHAVDLKTVRSTVQELESYLWALGGVYEAWQTMVCLPEVQAAPMHRRR